jgi:hypothetical protein
MPESFPFEPSAPLTPGRDDAAMPTRLRLAILSICVVGLSLVGFMEPEPAGQPSAVTAPAPVPPASSSVQPTPNPLPGPLLPRSTPVPIGWTAVGLDGGGVEGIVGRDGTFAPIATGPGVSLWLKDNRTGAVQIPEPGAVTQSLADGHLPLVTSRWSAGAATLSWTIFARSTGSRPLDLGPGDVPVGIEVVTLDGGANGGSWTMYALVGPDNPAAPASLQRVDVVGNAIWADGLLRLEASRQPDLSGTLDLARERPADALAGPNAGPLDTASADGRGAAYVGYEIRLRPGQQFQVAFLSPLKPIDVVGEASLKGFNPATPPGPVAQAWQERLDRVRVSLPDRQVQDAYYASLAYLLMARGPDTLFSGPTSEQAVWVRDVAYTGYALTATGYGADVAPVLRLLLSSQLPSGQQPPIVEANGQPREPLKTEWDAPGELIAAVSTYAQVAHDDAFLRASYPHLRAAAEFLRRQLRASRAPALLGTPEYGILPAGESAEDLYSADWHHYWDDFWALAGFQAGAQAARELGYPDDAAWMSAEEATLRTDLLASVATTPSADAKPFIPNGPEDTHSTAMSRSGTPAVWPYLVLDPRSALVQHSFQAYYDWTVRPYGGAYNHYGSNDWPYAGLSLAHAFYRLGMVDQTFQMLQWALDHQTAPNLYAWCEAVDPHAFAYRSGDCPHSWMAAEVILLVRDILVREDGSRLDLGPFPAAWLPPGGTIAVRGFPTRFGSASYTMSRSADGRRVDLTLGGDGAPDGYAISLPGSLRLGGAIVDGRPLALAGSSEVDLPRGAHHAVLTLQH